MSTSSVIEVKTAFRHVASEEFRDVPPENEVEWNFSARFKKKMAKLVRNEKSFAWKYVNAVKKRLAVALIIIVCNRKIKPRI